MTFTTIISAQALHDLIVAGAQPVLFDCTFDLTAPLAGRETYAQGHIPGARYVDLDHDLSGQPDGTNGRHPLPNRDAFAERLRALGLSSGRQVIAYDGNGGHFAARLWWMLRWLGHDAVAVLDGGRQAWVYQGFTLEQGLGSAPVAPGDFIAGASLVGGVVDADQVLANIDGGDLVVIDARDAARFRGEPHPFDTASGHIPGARNRFLRDNFDASGKFLSGADLASAFSALLAGTGPEKAVMQCGSGVTACVNVLAMEIAGMKGAMLYPGSWSEWTSDPSRPIAAGD